MKILSIDTAAKSCSAAVCRDESLVAEINLFRRQTHSRHLLEMVHQTLAMAGEKVENIDGFALTRGPGSFTGLRIGMSCVKGFAYALNKPVTAVSTLEALALQAAVDAADEDRLICPLMDARKKEVYFAGFRFRDGKLVKAADECVCAPEKLGGKVRGPCLFIGDGAALYREMLGEIFKDDAAFAPLNQNYIRAHTVALLALANFEKGEAADLSGLVPLYIRKSDAELNFARS